MPTLLQLISLATAVLALPGATASGNRELQPAAPDPKKVMVWMANPYPQPDHKPPITVAGFIAGLKPHRNAFTGLSYQYFAICGAGSNDVGGSNDCHPADAMGAPHLSQGHPILTPKDLGAQLTAGLGLGYQNSTLELWPTISYGNPGNRSVLDKLMTNDTAIAQFIADAISIAHEQQLTGFNFDVETSPDLINDTKWSAFLQKFGATLHAASPPIQISYDGGNLPVPGVEAMDRWISMGCYTSDLNGFLVDLAGGIKNSGAKFGVGLCPTCQTLSEDAIETRFAAIGTGPYGGVAREIDLWAADYQVPASPQWEYYWPQLEKWLQSP